jgi:hypothetical protein
LRSLTLPLSAQDLTPADHRQAVAQLVCGNVLSQYTMDVCLTNGAEWRFYSISGGTNTRLITVKVFGSWEQAAAYVKERLPHLKQKSGDRLPPIHEGKDDEGDMDSEDEENGGGPNDQPSASGGKGNKGGGNNGKGKTGGGTSKGNTGTGNTGKGNTGTGKTGRGKQQATSQEDVCVFIPLPQCFEDQLGPFSQRELEFAYIQTLPVMQPYLNAVRFDPTPPQARTHPYTHAHTRTHTHTHTHTHTQTHVHTTSHRRSEPAADPQHRPPKSTLELLDSTLRVKAFDVQHKCSTNS